MRRYLWMSLCLTGALSLGLLTGCSDKKVNYDMEHTQSTQNGIQTDGSSGLAQFSNAGTWKENWKATNEAGDTYDISISADISIPEVDQMSVVEVREAEMNGEFCKKIVEALFPGETVYYYDKEHWPKAKLQAEIDKCEDLIQGLRKPWEHDYSYLWDEDVASEEIKQFEELMEDAPDDYVPVTDYESLPHPEEHQARYIAEYMVEKDGVIYAMTFEETEDGEYEKTFVLKREEVSCPKEVQDEDMFLYGGEKSDKENQCTLTEQEAQEIAEQTLAKLRISNLVQEETLPLVWKGYALENTALPIDDVANGWVFSYGIGVDDLSFRQFGTEDDLDHEDKCMLFEDQDEPEGNDYYSMNAGIQIEVSDEGLISLTYTNPIEITSVTKDVELLPLDNIQTIMRNEMTEHIDLYPYLDKSDYFTNMELIYFRVRNQKEKGSYSYIPVWRLSVQSTRLDEDEQYIERPVYVNAIDGSIIYLQKVFGGE